MIRTYFILYPFQIKEVLREEVRKSFYETKINITYKGLIKINITYKVLIKFFLNQAILFTNKN